MDTSLKQRALRVLREFTVTDIFKCSFSFIGSTSSQPRQSSKKQQAKEHLTSSTSDISEVSITKNTGSSMSSILSSGSFASLNQHELADFIAKAINIPPDQIEQLLNAAAEAKSRGHHSTAKDTQQVLPEKDIEHTKHDQLASKDFDTINQSPELKSIKPVASSSPHDVALSPTCTTSLSKTTQMIASPSDKPVQSSTLIDSMRSPPQDVVSSYSINSSVFVLDSPDNVSVIENSTMKSPAKDVPLSPPPDPFSGNPIDPFFGKTYTIKDKNGTSGHVVDPLKSRADKIEKRLDKSLSPDEDMTRISSADFQPVASMTTSTVAPEDMTLIESPEKYSPNKLERSYDSAVCTKSPYVEGKSRHSWPKTAVDSPYKKAEVVRSAYPNAPSSFSPVLSMPSEPGNYIRPMTIGVPPPSLPVQPVPGISPLAIPSSQYPGQTSAIGFPGPQGFGLQHGNYMPTINGPLSGTFPMHYPAFPQPAPNALNTAIGQVPNQAVRQYPGSIYPPDGYTAPGFLGPVAISVGHPTHQAAPPYSMYSNNQQTLHLNTVSAGIAPRLATNTQAFSWQGQGIPHVSEQGHQQLQTAPPGLLQVGQPLSSQGMTLGTDSQPLSAPNRTTNSLTPIVIPGEVKLPPVCPVGIQTRSILTLHNSSSKWIYCMVKVAYCTVNGAQVTNSVDNPFFVPSRLIINPHTTIPIEVRDVLHQVNI